MFEIRPYEIAVVRKNGEFNPRSDTYGPNINSCVPLPEGMPVPKLRNDGNRVKASVFGQSRWNDLKCVRVGLETICFHPLQ